MKDKKTDPAVVQSRERSVYISVVSGHVGVEPMI
ncbi:hypothetical protein KHA80_21695 [Anaerobacillus sp. HL2]|nr:hypothetical protein KHA80_21695 [Anaerobacillus sp. HL2]